MEPPETFSGGVQKVGTFDACREEPHAVLGETASGHEEPDVGHEEPDAVLKEADAIHKEPSGGHQEPDAIHEGTDRAGG